MNPETSNDDTKEIAKRPGTDVLAHLGSAERALAEAHSVPVAKSIRDKAEALRVYCTQARISLSLQNQCAALKLKAERRIGDILAETISHSGGRPAKRSQAATVSKSLEDIGVTKSQSSRWQQIARIPDKVFEAYLGGYTAAEARDELTTAGLLRATLRLNTVDAMASSETFEWYTPRLYVEAARAALGTIDLDPASSKSANETVKAKKIFTFEQNGFTKPWAGRVFLNPPYGTSAGRSNQATWSAALIESFEAGQVSHAILLVSAATDASWFEALWDFPLCFVDHRIQFVGPNGRGRQPTHGNVFAALGVDPQRFRESFEQFGRIVVPDQCISRSLTPGQPSAHAHPGPAREAA